ncbi:MAG: hypothetical protein H6810_08465 [Phycisphaeraceae bacterium]|nr:MAG: hypothetical protein H6810_08465 [Phycisphaeraceae bacterium]
MRRRPGLILLEVLLALALFVMTSLTLLSVISQSIEGLRRSRDRLLAADHARNAMAQIEAGLARPETLNGPVPPWNEHEEEAADSSFVGIDPDDAPTPTFAVEPEWSLEIETEPTEYRGLTLVSVRAFRIDDSGFEFEGSPSYTLKQFVRLRQTDTDGVGLSAEPGPPPPGPATQPPSTRPPGRGGSR